MFMKTVSLNTIDHSYSITVSEVMYTRRITNVAPSMRRTMRVILFLVRYTSRGEDNRIDHPRN